MTCVREVLERFPPLRSGPPHGEVAGVGRWRRLAVGSAVAMALLEVVSAPTIDAPAVALVFAGTFLIGAWWATRSAVHGLALLALLSTIEVVFIPTYERNNGFDWTIQLLVAAASITCLVSSVAAIREGRRETSRALP